MNRGHVQPIPAKSELSSYSFRPELLARPFHDVQNVAHGNKTITFRISFVDDWNTTRFTKVLIERTIRTLFGIIREVFEGSTKNEHVCISECETASKGVAGMQPACVARITCVDPFRFWIKSLHISRQLSYGFLSAPLKANSDAQLLTSL